MTFIIYDEASDISQEMYNVRSSFSMEDKFLKPPQEPLHPIITVLRDKDIALVPEGWECAHFRGMMVAVKEGETPRAISLNVCTLVPFEHWPKVVLNKKPVIVDAEFTEVTDDVE